MIPLFPGFYPTQIGGPRPDPDGPGAILGKMAFITGLTEGVVFRGVVLGDGFGLAPGTDLLAGKVDPRGLLGLGFGIDGFFDVGAGAGAVEMQ